MDTQLLLYKGGQRTELLYNGNFVSTNGGWTYFDQPGDYDAFTPDVELGNFQNGFLEFNLGSYDFISSGTASVENIFTQLTNDIVYDVEIDFYSYVGATSLSLPRYIEYRFGIGDAYTNWIDVTSITSATTSSFALTASGDGIPRIEVRYNVDSNQYRFFIDRISIRNTRKIQYNVDLYKDVDIPLSFSIIDMREMDKRPSTISKTIQIPGTKNNNQIFGHIFEIDIKNYKFNPAKKVDCVLISNGIETFRGIMQMTNITRVNNSDDVEYSIILLGEQADLYTSLGKYKLNDLDFSEYNHELTPENIIGSWEGNIIRNNLPTTNMTYGASQAFYDTFYSFDHNGAFGLYFSASHTFQKGDFVKIDVTDSTLPIWVKWPSNPQYNGIRRVLDVPDQYSIVLAYPFGNSTNNESGFVSKVEVDGKGYVYPLIDIGNSHGYSYRFNDLFPSLYVKEYIDKMFELCGFSYSSNFLETEYFKRLIIPFNGGELSSSKDRLVQSVYAMVPGDGTWANGITYSVNSLGIPKTDTLDYPADYIGTYSSGYDYNNEWNGYEWTSTADMWVNMLISVSPEIRCTPDSYTNITLGPNPGDASNFNVNIFVEVVKLSTSMVETILDSWTENYYDATPLVNITSGYRTLTPRNGGRFSLIRSIQVQTGDKIFVRMTSKVTGVSITTSRGFFNNGSTTILGDIDVIHRADTYFRLDYISNQTYRPAYIGPFTLFVNDAIPTDIKCSDFFSSIIKMFNLYLTPDKDNPKLLYIEPRDDFYSSSEMLDWTYKRDVAQKLELKPLPELLGKRYIFSYQEDGDFYNDDYQKVFNEAYGTAIIDVDNDFVKNDYKVDVIFAPSPNVDFPVWGDKINPWIAETDLNSQLTNQSNPSRLGNNIRILFYGGIKGLKLPVRYETIVNSPTPYDYNYYPYAGHVDEPLYPTIDINFGMSRWLYYGNQNAYWTDNNLYNAFWRKTIEEANDKDSKLVSGMFYLNPQDIAQLDFRKIYYIEGHYLRLIKIHNWSPLANTPVKCDFLRMTKGYTWTPSSFKISEEKSIGGVVAPKPIPKDIKKFENVFINGHEKVVNGNNNYISQETENVRINGNTNSVHNGSSFVEIVGSGNTVISGISNVVIIGDNITATESNTTYINGVKIQNGNIIGLTVSGATPSLSQVLEVGNTMSLSNPYIYSPDGSSNYAIISDVDVQLYSNNGFIGLYANGTGGYVDIQTLDTGSWINLLTGGYINMSALDTNGYIDLYTATYQVKIDETAGVSINGITYPSTDGLNNQVIKTDGAGNLSFVDASTLVSSGYSFTGWTGSTGTYSIVMVGSNNVAGSYSVAYGFSSSATGEYSSAKGYLTIASGQYSTSEGYTSSSTGLASHAEGWSTVASGGYSHAEGYKTIASANSAHAEGYQTIASGAWSHAEGYLTVASGSFAHAQGRETLASGGYSHAEGYSTVASGQFAHAQGDDTTASGVASHASGDASVASGYISFVHGLSSTASGTASIVLGSNINGTLPNTTYIANRLIVSGTQGYFLLNKMTTTDRGSLTNLESGALIYNTTTNTPQWYNGSTWNNFGSETLQQTLDIGKTFSGYMQHIANGSTYSVGFNDSIYGDNRDFMITSEITLTNENIRLIKLGTNSVSMIADDQPNTLYSSIKTGGGINEFYSRNGEYFSTVTDSTMYEFRTIEQLQTTNNTTTTIWDYSIPQNESVLVYAKFIGSNSGFTASYAREVVATFRRDTGTAVQVGTSTNLFQHSTITGAAVTLDTSSNLIRARVQGLTGWTINWVCKIEMIVVT